MRSVCGRWPDSRMQVRNSSELVPLLLLLLFHLLLLLLLLPDPEQTTKLTTISVSTHHQLEMPPCVSGATDRGVSYAATGAQRCSHNFPADFRDGGKNPKLQQLEQPDVQFEPAVKRLSNRLLGTFLLLGVCLQGPENHPHCPVAEQNILF